MTIASESRMPTSNSGEVRDRGRVRSPGGLRDRRRIHLLRPGDTVDVGGEATESLSLFNTLSLTEARPLLATSTNWIVAGWTRNTSGSPVSSFTTELVVPPEPTNRGSQLIYLFPGMQPSSGAPFQTILQPVLQWGDSGEDDDGINRTGAFWSAASWIVPDANGDAHHTPHVRVAPGDTLTGVIRLLTSANGLFTYSCEFAELPATRFAVTSMPELIWCVETLEAYEPEGANEPPYDLNARTEYPDTGRTAFAGISVVSGDADDALAWAIEDVVTPFCERVEVVDT